MSVSKMVDRSWPIIALPCSGIEQKEIRPNLGRKAVPFLSPDSLQISDTPR